MTGNSRQQQQHQQAPCSSRVLIVPSSLKRQRRRQPPCWALGWKVAAATSSSNSDDNKIDRETTIIAGLLPPGRNLRDYQETIEQWRQLQQSSSSSSSSSSIDDCTCLVDSLQVVAFWDLTIVSAEDSNHNNKQYTKAGLPILTLQDGFPWWKKRESAPSNDGRRDQVLYYQLDDDNDTRSGNPCCAYFCSSYGSHTDWSLFLNRINHAHTVLRIIQDGSIPAMPACVATTTTALSPKSEKDVAPPNVDFPSSDISTQQPPVSEKLKKLLLYNSLTFLHIRECLVNSEPNNTASSTTMRLLSWIPLVQCLRAYKTLSSPLPRKAYICNHCSKPCRIPSPSELVDIRAARLNAVLSAAIDTILGVAVGALLLWIWQHANMLGGVSYVHATLSTFQALRDQIGWLETFPAGFKLNVPLTENMGHEIRNLMHHQLRFLLATIWNSHLGGQWGIRLLAVLSILGGWSTILAVVMDVWRLENLHLTLMAISFRKLYQAEVYLLGALFRLFRGKKRNILRQRTDSMEYDVMQLLVGTIGFCICVFLWTTILVYYTFFVIWNFGMNIPIIALWILYAMSRSFPSGSLIYRLGHADWFPQDSYVEFIASPESHDPVQHSTLRSIPVATTRILSNHIAAPFNRVIKWYLMSFLEVLYPRASNPSPVSLPLESFMLDLKLWKSYATAEVDVPVAFATKSKSE